jgi:predicted metal-binding membrane protein
LESDGDGLVQWESLPAWIALAIVAALSWIVTLQQAAIMGGGIGTMGMRLGPFLSMWTMMMAAMMFPSLSSVVILWVNFIRRKFSAWIAFGRITLFAAGYLVAWTLTGVAAFFCLLWFEQLSGWAGVYARLLDAVILAGGGVYQLTSWKAACLRHCRTPLVCWRNTLAVAD